MSLPLGLSAWVKDMRDRAMSYSPADGKWDALTKWTDPREIEFGDRVRNEIARENTASASSNDDEVVRKAMKAHGMGLVDYLESVLGGGTDGGRSEVPASPVSPGSGHPVSDVPAVMPETLVVPTGFEPVSPP